MKKKIYKISLMRTEKTRYRIIIHKASFYEVLGSYVIFKNSKNFDCLYINRERLFFWLTKGSVCELNAFNLLKVLLIPDIQVYKKYTNKNYYD